MSIPVYISELKGYLKALQHICGSSFNFGVTCSSFEGEINEFLKSKDQKYHVETSSIIDFKIIKHEVYRFVLNGMIAPQKFPNKQVLDYYKDLLIESINEYYGLASTTENNKGVFHPIITGPVYRLYLKDEDVSKSFFFLVKIENYMVVTYFREKTR